MPAKNKVEIQYRYYDMPPGSHALALLGMGWYREYDQDIGNQHFHNYMEIGYCREGRGQLHLDHQIRPYGPGMLSAIPPHFIHSTLSQPGTKSYWEYLFLDVEGLLGAMYGGDIGRITEMTERIYHSAVFVEGRANPELESLVLAIMEEFRSKDEMYLECAHHMLRALLIKIAQLHRGTARKIPHGQNRLAILGALQYVQEHYMDKIRMEELADACSLSETHFRRIFTEYMSMPPLAYVNLVRIEMACKLLRTSGDSVSDIASRCGFSSLASFNRNFKEIIGAVPMQWRKNTAYYERKLEDQRVLAFYGWL